jgi:hypothetical protein
MIANPRFHCWRDAERLMNPAEIVVHVVQSNRVFQVFKFFGEGIRQSGKAAHGHTHREVLPLDIRRGDVLKVWRTADNRATRSHADCGAVAGLWRLASIAVNLLQHRVINLLAERVSNRVQIDAVTVRGQLHTIRQSLSQVLNKVVRRSGVASPNEPAGNELGVRINRYPCPSVASRAVHSLLKRAIPFLRINERPNLIALDSLTRKIAKNSILIFRTGATKIAQQIHNRGAMNARHSTDGAQGISLYQCSNYLFPLFGAQLVHASIMLERSSIVKREINYFLPHRLAAALRAISLRLRADKALARALPPFNPPSLPSITAAGFLSPVERATIPAAS